jgi:hypothetical protein
VHFEIAVIGVRFARQQAFELAPSCLRTQFFERRLGVGDDGGVAFGFAELDQLERIGDFPLDPLVAADRLVQSGPLAQQRLGPSGVIPQVRIFGLGVQLGETPGCSLPVKDASSAAPTTC